MSVFLIDLMVLRVEIMIKFVKVLMMNILKNFSWLLFCVVMLDLMTLDLVMLCFLELFRVGHWDTIFVTAMFWGVAMHQLLMSVIIMDRMLRVPPALMNKLTRMEGMSSPVKFVLLLVGIKRFHLEDKFAMACVDVVTMEFARVVLKAAFCLVPSIQVKLFEVVAPLELKLIGMIVPREHLNVIVKGIPGHVFVLQAFTPWMTCRRPEVHPQILSLILRPYRSKCIIKMPHFNTINGE